MQELWGSLLSALEAKHRVEIVLRVRQGWVKLQSRQKVLDGLLALALTRQDSTQVAVGACMPRGQFDGPTKVAQRLIEFAEAHEDGPPIVIDIGVVGSELESASEVWDGLVQSAALVEGCSQIVV